MTTHTNLIARTALDVIGQTPLIELRAASKTTKSLILGKAEFLNPGGSVKDRAALAMIQDAKHTGRLKPGGIIVEGTAGNTGIGLAMVGRILGHHSVIVIPDTQSEEKKIQLRVFGAEVIEVPAVPFSNPNNYVKISERIANQLNQQNQAGAFWANQFDNLANREGHRLTTGPEIIRQTNGTVDGFVSSVGTGGTLAGVSLALRESHSPAIVALADPPGSALHNWYSRGELTSVGQSYTEGIGQGRITANLQGIKMDKSYFIPDEESLKIIYELADSEGLAMGGSTGVNIAGAIKLARELGAGHTVVTILCDLGTRYFSKIYNQEYLLAKNLPQPNRLGQKVVIEIPFIK